MDRRTLIQARVAVVQNLCCAVEQHCPLLYASVLQNSPLMVMPSSTPLLLGSLTWKVPLLGTTDSGKDSE